MARARGHGRRRAARAQLDLVAGRMGHSVPTQCQAGVGRRCAQARRSEQVPHVLCVEPVKGDDRQHQRRRDEQQRRPLRIDPPDRTPHGIHLPLRSVTAAGHEAKAYMRLIIWRKRRERERCGLLRRSGRRGRAFQGLDRWEAGASGFRARGLGAVLGEIPAASAGRTELFARVGWRWGARFLPAQE